MGTAGRTFRIFISSTFGDLQEERNALHRTVFPQLRELCRRHSCGFEAIDLRWGVREEAGLDQLTMPICLGEIARCQRISPRPNFIVLLGDRYGWRPLPPTITADEFDAIERRVPDPDNLVLLRTWYRRDDNAVPPEYCLQARRVELPDHATQQELEAARAAEAGEWAAIEVRLSAVLRTALQPLTDEQRIRFTASATEQEIAAGSMRVADASRHVFCFFRTIEGLPDDHTAHPYLDMDTGGRVDRKAQARLADLKERLQRLLSENVHHYQARWTGRGITTDHLDTLCADVLRRLAAVIEAEIGYLADVDPLDQEVADHDAFGAQRSHIFLGRETSLAAIATYLAGGRAGFLGVLGAAGSGKSALMAVAAEAARRSQPAAAVVTRFIGATPASTDGRTLLADLCRQITRAYGGDEAEIPTEYQALVDELPRRLALAKADQPLLVFIDALDQLNESHGARALVWLPATLPPHVRLVVSTAPSDCCGVLERRLPAEDLQRLEPLDAANGEVILTAWLREAGRTLQPAQRAEILSKFNREGLPLYLRLAFEEARLWRSSTAPVELAPNTPGLIRSLFTRLAGAANHGPILVSRVLGYIAAAKNGLAEEELIDLLSRDETVIEDFERRTFHRPLERRLPVVVWSRLYFDLERYLGERIGDGTKLLGFFHRQLAEVAAADYLTGNLKPVLHGKLAAYFDEQRLFTEGGDKRVPNRRKLSELPFQQTGAEQWAALHRTLTDFEFLEAKCVHAGVVRTEDKSRRSHSGVYELIEDYRRALADMPSADAAFPLEKFQVLSVLSRTLGRTALGLAESPETLFPHLYNQLRWQADTPPALRDALERHRETFRRPWLRLLNGHNLSPFLIRTLAKENTCIYGARFIADGRAVIAGVKDSIRIYESATGTLLARHHFPLSENGWIERLALSPDERWVVFRALADRSGLLVSLDLVSGCRRVFGGGTATDICFSPDGHWIVIAHEGDSDGKGHLSVFDAELVVGESAGTRDDAADSSDAYLHPTRQIEVAGGEIRACRFTPDGAQLVGIGHTGTLFTLDFASGRLLQTFGVSLDRPLQDGMRVQCGCAVSADGTQAAAVSRWGLRIWNLAGGCVLLDSPAARGNVDLITNGGTPCRFSPDGRTLATCFGTEIRFFDAATGRETGVLSGHRSPVSDLCFSPDGRLLLSTSEDGTVKLWDAHRALDPTKPTASDGVIYSCCAFDRQGQRALFAGLSTVELWDAKQTTPHKIFSLDAGAPAPWHEKILAVSSCDIAPDGRTLLLSGAAGHLIQVADEGEGKVLEFAGEDLYIVTKCRYSPDGHYVLASSMLGLRSWSAADGAEMPFRCGHDHATFALSPNTRLLFYAQDTHYGEMADTDTMQALVAFAGWEDNREERRVCRFGDAERGVVSCDFSPDSEWIATGNVSGRARIWSTRTGEEHTFLIGHYGDVVVCCFSPDGTKLLTASRHDDRIKIWDVPSRKTWEIDTCLAQAWGLTEGLRAGAFSPDGRRLIVCDRHSQALFFSLEHIAVDLPVLAAWIEEAGFQVLCRSCGVPAPLRDTELGGPWRCPACGALFHLRSTPSPPWLPLDGDSSVRVFNEVSRPSAPEESWPDAATVNAAVVTEGVAGSLARCAADSGGFPDPERLFGELDIDPAVLALIHSRDARRLQVIPLSLSGRVLYIAMVDPRSAIVLDEICFMTGFRVKGIRYPRHEILQALEKYYP